MTHRFVVIGIPWAMVLALSPARGGLAAESMTPAGTLAPYVNDDTFVAAYLNLSALPKKGANEDSSLFAVLPFLDGDAQATLMVLHGLDQTARAIAAAGADSVYMVAGLADVNQQGGPVFVFQVKQGTAAKEVAKVLTSVLGKAGQWTEGVGVREDGANAVLVGMPATLDRYASFAEGERNDLIEPLGKLSDGGAVMAAVFCPGPDFRRVVRELWPELPGGLAPLRGELADKWRHVEVSVDASPTALPQISLETSDAESAEIFATLWRDIPEAMTTLSDVDRIPKDVREHVRSLIDAFPAQVEGNRVTLQFPVDEAQLDNLRSLAGETVDASMQSSRRNKRGQRLKEMAVAMLNHESVKKTLPAAAIRDKEGRPLLSWRVTILPYMGESEAELYKQFHLDEPWDSPHNRTLIAKMPAVYADPDPKLNELSGVGKTTYQVPVAPETIFHSDEGIVMRDITDGTSRTIMIVEVVPSQAVEWSKPEDWEVDIQNPLAGVKRDDRSVFMIAGADGHVEAIPVNVDFKKFRGLLTRNGGEVFDWP